ncbi:MAG TPA: hypothetical protein VFN21_04740 [Acidimicrobiales bacterium]|nr:hypothetical protein [Acidimicrobiales bacterium]
MGVAVLPIVVEMVRAGVTGWVPARDAAPTVLRAKVALGLPPTLLGMYTDASTWIGVPTYFPGAWHLYWMALPIRLLGTSWGPLVAMALLNVLWVCLAGWFVRRRLGDRAAIGALALMAVLMFTLSPALLVSPVPMVMVLPAFAAFCFGVWALAAGDDGVLPALALVTSFLLLDHLVLTMLVPVILVAGVTLWAGGLLLERRRNLQAWRERSRGIRRSLAGATVVTVVLWLPAVAQQLFGDSGNLGNLFRAGRTQPAATMSYTDGLSRWLDLFTYPDFWLRASREHSYLVSGGPAPSTAAVVVAGAVLVVAVVLLGVAAFRRRDRPACTVLVLAFVGLTAVWFNLERAVSANGPHPAYVQSSWVVAMFVTFGLAYAAVRTVPEGPRRLALPGAFGCLALFTALNLPHANVGTGVTSASDLELRLASQMNPLVVDALRDRSMVAVGKGAFGMYPVSAAAVVALNDAGIPVCTENIPQFGPSRIPECGTRHPEVEIRVDPLRPLDADSDGWELIAQVSPLSPAEWKRFQRLSREITTAVDRFQATGEPLKPTPEFVRVAEAATDGKLDLGTPEAIAFLNVTGPGKLMHSDVGRGMIATFVANGERMIDDYGGADADGVNVFDLGVPREELFEWARFRGEVWGNSLAVRARPTG